MLYWSLQGRIVWMVTDGLCVFLKHEDAVVVPQDPTIENYTKAFERAHPDHPTRVHRAEMYRERYDTGVREWRDTGRIPLVELED